MKSLERSINDSFYGETPNYHIPKYNTIEGGIIDSSPKYSDGIGPGTYTYNALLGSVEKKNNDFGFIKPYGNTKYNKAIEKV